MDIEKIIYKCYSECPRSVKLYHDFAGMNLEEVVEDFLKKMKDFKQLEFHNVEHEGDLVGYFGITKEYAIPLLWTFFIRPKYRKTELLWKEIEKCFDGSFAAIVFKSNEPAKKYLRNNGGNEVIKDNASVFYFKE